ncbi:MAG: AbrB/MazE/SpoVT family DNA-binding domain-containing protein [Clostridia bacterium]|nr:AbrB/MazE/SpoVT family DNA-binding domain-containing protein [Clostridia bacterium]
MHSTGIIKKVDNLGRIVLPKEIRKKLKIRENDELEMFIENEDTILLKKYSAMRDLKKDCMIYSELLHRETGFKVLFTDNEKIIACKGKNTALLNGEEISEDVIEVINGRMAYSVNTATNFKVLKTDENLYPKVIVPIIVESKTIGSVILFSDDEPRRGVKDKEYDLLRFVVSLIAMKLEI